MNIEITANESERPGRPPSKDWWIPYNGELKLSFQKILAVNPTEEVRVTFNDGSYWKVRIAEPTPTPRSTNPG